MELTQSDFVNRDLEYRLFNRTCLLVIAASVFFIFLDTFLTGEYHSVFVSATTLIITSWFYYQSRVMGRYRKVLMPFIFFLLLSVNLAWLTGGRLNLPNSTVLILVTMVTMILVPDIFRKWLIIFFIFNILVFGAIEILSKERVAVIVNPKIDLYVSVTMLFFSFSVVTYLVTFFKKRYEVEREKVFQQNQELDTRYAEIEDKNRELTNKQEEILAQRDVIDQQIKTLQKQANDLQTANRQINNLNQALEYKVQERTIELLDLNKELDILFYSSSHDFRRPITTLMGINEIARLTIKDETSMELFRKVEDTANTMDKMLSKFFMLYKINHYKSEKDVVSINDFIENQMKPVISRGGSDISLNASIEHKIFKDDDPRNSLIQIILANLIENSIAYRRYEPLEITVNTAEEGDAFILTVDDNGMGIQAEYKHKIFDMYFRGTLLSKGNGLGLYVVKKAVEKMEGNIQVESVPQMYTTFQVSFRL